MKKFVSAKKVTEKTIAKYVTKAGLAPDLSDNSIWVDTDEGGHLLVDFDETRKSITIFSHFAPHKKQFETVRRAIKRYAEINPIFLLDHDCGDEVMRVKSEFPVQHGLIPRQLIDVLLRFKFLVDQIQSYQSRYDDQGLPV